MTIWIDAQLSPSLALWINKNFKSITAKSIRSMGLLNASDTLTFSEASKENIIIMSKDQDFVNLVNAKGTPPYLIWITCGNTSNDRMRRLLENNLEQAVRLLKDGEKIVEISDG